MDRDIESLVKRNADKIKYSRIKAAMQSSMGEQLVWVLVEGVNDELFYERMFDGNSVMIRTAVSEQDDDGGKTIVCSVVSKLLKEDCVNNVIGIVDRDYDDYCKSSTSERMNIFKTDYRDLEMSLLADDGLHAEFLDACCMRSEVLKSCIEIARQMGYIRITAVVNGIAPVLKKWGNNCVWDRTSKSREENWKDNLLEKMNCHCLRKGLQTISSDDIEKTKYLYNLDCKHFAHICRGHDFLSLLAYMIGQAHCWDEKRIFVWWCENYPIDSIERMNLYNDIYQWQNDKHLQILN